MNIQDAAKEAAASNKCITIRSEGEVWFKVRPSNDPYWLCSGEHPDGLHRVKGWQPSLDDLISDEWEVI